MTRTLDVQVAPASWVSSPDDSKRRLRALADDARELASAEGASGELLEMLAQLGPVFTGFARFLATRADVTPAALRADFGRVADRVAPAAYDEVREVLETEWRCPVEQVCFGIDETPVETRFPSQSHRAWVSPTDGVVVTCVPRAFEAQLERDLQILPMLSTALTPTLGGRHVFDRLVDDYRHHARNLLNLSDDVAAGAALVADAERFPALRARRPHPGLSSARVSVWDDIAAVPPDTAGFDRADAGASACRAWLRQALLGRTFPEEPAPSDFIVAGRRQVALAGRLFTSLPRDAQQNVQGYLIAIAAGDPDLAGRYLRRELAAGRGADEAGFRRRIRYAWSVNTDAAGGSQLMAQLLLHWRIAVEHGYRPTTRLVSFYRGCLAAVSAATAIGAQPDVLRDALETLQVRVAASQIEALTGVSLSRVRSTREAQWRLLTALAPDPVEPTPDVNMTAARPALVGALLAALAAVGFTVPTLAASGVTSAEPIGALVFAILGALALFRIMFRRD